MQKQFRNSRGNHWECTTLFCCIESAYIVTDCCTFQFSALFSTVIWAYLYVWSVHNMTFPRHFDCTYVNTQKYEFRTISGRSTISGRRAIGALKGRQLLLGLSSSNWRPQGARNLRFIFAGFWNDLKVKRPGALIMPNSVIFISPVEVGNKKYCRSPFFSEHLI